jgi:DNA-directed RNA polymerase specialized sigma24 family protein
MMRDEGPDHAADYLSDETRKPGTGITVRTPRPARESLYSFDREVAGIPTSISTRAAYLGDMDRDDDTALARLMDSLLERLSPRQRQAVELVAIAGLTFGAAATEMGTSKATLYAHYRDGIRKLRESLTATPWAAALIGPWLSQDDDGDDDPSGPGIVVPFPRLSLDDELDKGQAAA